MTRRALMVVAKQPAPGQTKTRLSPPLDAVDASALYECFLRDTLEIVREARQTLDFQPIIVYLPADADGYFRTLAPDFDLILQQGRDLSERLNNATSHCLTYYLIGLKKPAPDLFLKVTMSTPRVVEDTLAEAKLNGLHVEMLPICYDIDFVQDLKRLVVELDQASPTIAAHTRAFVEAHPIMARVGEL